MADDDTREKSGGGEDSGQEKTEEPSQHKREKSRQRGAVAKSVEVNSAFILIFGLLLLYFMGSAAIVNLGDAAKKIFMESGASRISMVNAERFFLQGFVTLISTILPIVAILMLIGLASSIAQVGFLFTTQTLEFSWDKLDPLKGIKRIFFSRRSVEELAKSVLKIIIVAVVGYFSLKSVVNESIMVLDSDIGIVMSFIGKSSVSVGLKMGLAFLALALLDYMFQWREHQRQLRMTRHELKEETKETEGDPLLKSRIRSIQRSMARKRMIAEVPKADVVITNTGHVAIALKYEVGKMEAPKVIAKGAELLAQKIKAIAILHNIPIVEDQPLAQSLYKMVDVGETIPDKLYKAVAEILAYVYRLKNTRFGFGLN